MSKYKLALTFNVPNILSFFRLSLTPFLILALSEGKYDIALIVFVIAAITDTLDGLTARWWGMKTPLGKFLDPMADKILMTAAYITLTIPLPNAHYSIPIWLTILVISRDVFIVLTALLMHVVVDIKNFEPTIWGKICTTLQVFTVLVVLLAHLTSFVTPALNFFYYTTLIFTLLSGFHYLFKTVHSLDTEDIS